MQIIPEKLQCLSDVCPDYLALQLIRFWKTISTTRFHMSIKDSSCDETLVASSANVRSFASVISLVNDQRGSLSEGFAALIARVLPLPGMSDIVSSQKGLAGEALSAHFAGVRLLAGVRPVVDFEALRSLQLFAA